METIALFYLVGYVIFFVILLLLEDDKLHPTLGFSWLLLTSILSWFGVILFVWLWIKDTIEDHKFIKRLKKGDYDESKD